jgi:hypothetical protein
MKTRKLGSHGPAVSALSLGCMGMSGMYGQSDESQSVRTIHDAIDAGINLLDTGDFYGMGHNELLVRKAIEGRRDQVLLSVKFGALRDPRGGWIGFDARPVAVKNFLTYRRSGSALTTSTSIVRRGWTPLFPSKKLLAPSPIWSRRATFVTLDSPRSAWTRSAVRRRSIPSAICRLNTP